MIIIFIDVKIYYSPITSYGGMEESEYMYIERFLRTAIEAVSFLTLE